MLRLVLLRDHLEYSNTFAAMGASAVCLEFTVEQRSADGQREFSEGRANGDWQTLDRPWKMASY